MPYANVLVGTDFSAPSREAVRTGGRIAERFGARLSLLYVYDLDLFAAMLMRPRREVEASIHEAARAELARVAREDLGGAPVEQAVVRQKSPALAIVTYAKEHHADLCIVGKRGAGGPPRMLIGGVSERVVRHAGCDVLVVSPDGPPPDLRHLLVATDFSDASLAAVERGATLARLCQARVTLLHVHDTSVPALASRDGRLFEEHAELLTSVVERLDELRRSRFAPEVQVAIEALLNVSPATAVRSVASDAGADLIVVGTHGRTGLRRMFIGSVAERVVRHADCSVLVVRGTEERP